MTTKLSIITDIVSMIRNKISTDYPIDDDVEQWNELNVNGGVSWLDNEIGLFNDLMTILYDENYDYMEDVFDECSTVNEVINYLSNNLDDDYINMLHFYTTNKGTDNPYHFTLRDQENKMQIKKYFEPNDDESDEYQSKRLCK